MKTETEISEQKGIMNLLAGLFGAVRNPIAHAPKVTWPMSEQDVLDIFALISFVQPLVDATKERQRLRRGRTFVSYDRIG